MGTSRFLVFDWYRLVSSVKILKGLLTSYKAVCQPADSQDAGAQKCKTSRDASPKSIIQLLMCASHPQTMRNYAVNGKPSAFPKWYQCPLNSELKIHFPLMPDQAIYPIRHKHPTI